jgi:hypothetical protein
VAGALFDAVAQIEETPTSCTPSARMDECLRDRSEQLIETEVRGSSLAVAHAG